MATITKFYLLNATSSNTGTMPANTPATIAGGKVGTGTEATGNTTARDATDTPGASNPDLESVCTAQAATSAQRLGHRRFVSRPLAAQTFAAADGTWTMDYAAFCSNLNHISFAADGPHASVYLWRPSGGTRVGTVVAALLSGISLTTTEANNNATGTWSGTQAILDGDILVFDVYTEFTQTMATAYTDSFSYDGTTDASATTAASFISAPAPVTLLAGGAAAAIPDVAHALSVT